MINFKPLNKHLEFPSPEDLKKPKGIIYLQNNKRNFFFDRQQPTTKTKYLYLVILSPFPFSILCFDITKALILTIQILPFN